MRSEVDRLITESLLPSASKAIDEVILELGWLYDQWAAAGVDASHQAWLEQLMNKLSWWSGRLAAEGSR